MDCRYGLSALWGGPRSPACGGGWPVTRGEDGRSARLEATQALLAEGLGRLVSGDDWQAFLAVQARLHGYSIGGSPIGVMRSSQ